MDIHSSPPVEGRRQVAIWLLVVCALVYGMVVLGGVTRLTGSGLSMVEWDPIMGWIPPMSEEAWSDAYEKYRLTPEYQKVNRGFGLEGFKEIFWLEYLHRVLGRLIGIAFFIPFVYFLIRGHIRGSLIPKTATMFVLGGLQGLMGWYMVKSGLIDNPHVSPYRLTAHLLLALLIYAYMLWVALDLLMPRATGEEARVPGGLRRKTYWLTGFAVLTIASGGFVAGLKAGFAYNTFPLMNGRLIPDGYLTLSPWYLNLFENVAAVQFNHRLLAIALLVAVIAFWLAARRYALPRQVALGMHALLAAALLQVALGITTLLMHVPLPLAALHQAGGVLVLTALVYLSHRVYRLGRAELALRGPVPA
jgi:cytochrome c oxidase assembly protein subunit 15